MYTVTFSHFRNPCVLVYQFKKINVEAHIRSIVDVECIRSYHSISILLFLLQSDPITRFSLRAIKTNEYVTRRKRTIMDSGHRTKCVKYYLGITSRVGRCRDRTYTMVIDKIVILDCQGTPGLQYKNNIVGPRRYFLGLYNYY